MTSRSQLLLSFLAFYLLLIFFLRSKCWQDPTSKFFRPEIAYKPGYSAYRIQQSIQFADGIAKEKYEKHLDEPPELCIGVPSVQREGISYLKSTLGSLQQGLNPEERRKLRFVVLLAHIRQEDHSDYGQPWLQEMVDQFVLYTDDPQRLELAKTMTPNSTHAIKSKFDYSIVLEECLKTNAPYILMVEDDTVVMDGWRSKTMKALHDASTKTWEMGRKDFLYLRLFYYESLLGWNAESWPVYLKYSVAVTATVLAVLIILRRLVSVTRPVLTNFAILCTTFVFTPLLILLFFAAGTIWAFNPTAGVHLMPKYACCGQGLVFPRGVVVDEILPLLQKNRFSLSPTDSFIEDYADATGALRWAMTPVVMQHVGGQSSYDDERSNWGEMTPSDIWNFAFENNDPNHLRGNSH